MRRASATGKLGTSLGLALLAGCTPASLPKALPRCQPGAPEPGVGRIQFEFDEQEQVRAKKTDTNSDGIFDQVVSYEAGRPKSAEADRDLDGQPDLWIRYDDDGRESAWKWLPAGSTEPVETSDAEVARAALSNLGTSLADGATPECLESGASRAYQDRLTRRLYSKWHWQGARQAGLSTELRFALSAQGEILSACVVRSSDADLERSAVRALYRAAPFEAMPEGASCLSGKPLLANFGTR